MTLNLPNFPFKSSAIQYTISAYFVGFDIYAKYITSGSRSQCALDDDTSHGALDDCSHCSVDECSHFESSLQTCKNDVNIVKNYEILYCIL